MKDIINGLIERFRRQHVQARRYVALMLVLALLTTLFVNWQLHGVGISMTADYHCGYEEHQHTAACYEKVLTCGYEEAGERRAGPADRQRPHPVQSGLHGAVAAPDPLHGAHRVHSFSGKARPPELK